MRDLVERKEVKECIEALKQRFMRQAVNLSTPQEDREKAAMKHHLLGQLVAEVANYQPEDQQNGN